MNGNIVTVTIFAKVYARLVLSDEIVLYIQQNDIVRNTLLYTEILRLHLAAAQ